MTYHIHIQGIVQGVGFRPFVYKLALKQGEFGNVNNTTDGVHININGDIENANSFLKEILEKAPDLSIITEYSIKEVENIEFNDFQIVHSESCEEPNLLLTPDFALCDDCRSELHNPQDKRYRYPFITCTNCGPRYSIITKLPYDRENTTMVHFKMCIPCQKEYDNPLDRRYYSQTNSCDDCGINITIFEDGNYVSPENYIDYIVKGWESGKIIAIKGIGGYLLTCDATNSDVIRELRRRKYRPTKPFALMYPSIEILKGDVQIGKKELNELNSVIAPIVLLRLKDEQISNIDISEIAHNLDRIGVMLPYAPLFELLMNQFNKPIIATSGNISNSTIIYNNDKAIKDLTKIADVIVSNDRDIVLPQDDGVVKFASKSEIKIIIRRSRGLAPTYLNSQLKLPSITAISTGAMLKSAFTILNKNNLYISQYLGNTDTYDAQLNYQDTLRHFDKLLNLKPDIIYVDKHPDYFSSIFGRELAQKYKVEVKAIQHHKAHFAAVLGENNLIDIDEKVLGVVFDGTGYGDDGNIWGGEFFIYENRKIERYHHLDYFDFILGDKMVMEPRISALVIANNQDIDMQLLKNKFSESEWMIYKQLIKNKNKLKSSSIGRLFDAAASMILSFDRQTYEGEAAMKLESIASIYLEKNELNINDAYIKNEVSNLLKLIIQGVFNSIITGEDKGKIAVRFHLSIVQYIKNISNVSEVKQIAFSGGVFQNGLLLDMIIMYLSPQYKLYFHQQLSPNDECISFGQLIAGVNNF